jgi:hypothetical protein
VGGSNCEVGFGSEADVAASVNRRLLYPGKPTSVAEATTSAQGHCGSRTFCGYSFSEKLDEMRDTLGNMRERAGDNEAAVGKPDQDNVVEVLVQHVIDHVADMCAETHQIASR